MADHSSENQILDSAHARLLAVSFNSLLGRDILPDGLPEEAADLPKALYEAPQIILSHDTSDDPRLTYANIAAQVLWEMTWYELIGLPSRKTAEPQHRGQRSEMFDDMRRKGFTENYEGVRISATGKRFMIQKAVIWTLYDENGIKRGEAATFTKTTPLP